MPDKFIGGVEEVYAVGNEILFVSLYGKETFSYNTSTISMVIIPKQILMNCYY